MSNAIIQVEHLGKMFRIGLIRQNEYSIRWMLNNVLEEFLNRLRALRERRAPSASDREFWALKDISFEVQPGESVGLIGINGSGKSTLLKIINRVVYPTEGRVTVVGRIGSLIEVAAGFHNELTGRENLLLNTAIHGLSKEETEEHFDDIVNFADIHDFLDTPVKKYSSGMRIRLAFSIAAHTDPDILLIDEAFAVGDVGFREKAMHRIEELSAQGCTLIFVSHNMPHVQRLCNRILWLEKGCLVADGDADELAQAYLEQTLGQQQQATPAKQIQ
jgi:lipopolysaccharide transport system ATP-binding protein